ncbi:replication endonuclease [Mariprofundus ferrooxydans]|uniref:replication endonuclease n=1 Tax=Mariprofundus ferrooxydans TaxID=314344 RepID=UPI000363B4D1|nr:replication endonuclease [Mariprofundus ferrooxydans]
MKKKKHNLKIATEQLAKLQTKQQQNEFSAFIERERNAALVRKYTATVARTGHKEAERRAKLDADNHTEALIVQETQRLQALQLAQLLRATIDKKTTEQVEDTYRADVASSLMRKFNKIKKENGIVAAAKFIEAFNTKHSDFKFYSYDDRDIITLAKACAEQCAEFARRFRNDIQFAVILMHQHADTMHVEHATAIDNDPVIITNKYTDEMWWRPRLRRIIRRKREELAVECGLVGKESSHYSSKLTQDEREQQLERNKKWAAKTVLVCDDTRLNMSDLVESKEQCYQAELVTMLAGLRDIQDANGWHAAMITPTCPAAFRRLGVTSAESADHLRRMWACSRAQAKRENLDIRGMQVWQPHKDGIAHQHIYCIGEKLQLERFAEIVRAHSLKLYPDEKGAQEHRCDVLYEDKDKGRLSSYAARYVTRLAKKSDDETCATDTATAEDSWYSAHGIRRVSFFGLPSKKLWRYFREASREICNTKQLKKIRKAARNGEYAGFVQALHWTGNKRALDFETLHEEVENRYKEKVKKESGIRFQTAYILKSTKKWTFEVLRTVIPNYPSAAAGGVKEALSAVFEQVQHEEPVPIPA